MAGGLKDNVGIIDRKQTLDDKKNQNDIPPNWADVLLDFVAGEAELIEFLH